MPALSRLISRPTAAASAGQLPIGTTGAASATKAAAARRTFISIAPPTPRLPTAATALRSYPAVIATPPPSTTTHSLFHTSTTKMSSATSFYDFKPADSKFPLSSVFCILFSHQQRALSAAHPTCRHLPARSLHTVLVRSWTLRAASQTTTRGMARWQHDAAMRLRPKLLIALPPQSTRLCATI